MEKIIMRTSYTDTGFCCACDLLDGWIVSGGKDFDKFDRYVRESIDFYIKQARADGDSYPEVFDGEYEVVYHFDTRALLQYLQRTLTLSAIGKASGINVKQLSHYATGIKHPRPKQEARIREGVKALAATLSSATA